MSNQSDEFDFLVPWCGDVVPWQPWYADQSNKRYNYYNPETNKWEKRAIDWRENKPFKAAYKVKGLVDSTSPRMLMKDVSTEQDFIIRSGDFFVAMEQLAVVHGLFIGEWIFRKTAGRYYGLKLYY